MLSISVTIQLWIQVFWLISVQFNIRNTLPKYCTFLLGQPIYINVEFHSHINLYIHTYMLTCTHAYIYTYKHTYDGVLISLEADLLANVVGRN